MNNLKKLKEMYKITQYDLAKLLNSSQQQMSRYETGERQLKEDQIIVICKAYNVSADFLLGLKDK